jgi:CRISPR-associated exonuclease Cas4
VLVAGMPEPMISASELERFCYCPLSWWLSLDKEMVSESLKEGERRHEDFNTDLRTILENEKKTLQWEGVVLWFSLISTFLALIGLFIFNRNLYRDLIWISVMPTMLWIGLMLYLVYISGRTEIGKSLRLNRTLALSSVVIVFLVLNAIIIFDVPLEMAAIFLVLSLFWLIGTSMVLYLSLAAQMKMELKRKEMHLTAKISYIGNEKAEVIYSEKYGLSGKPDFILEEANEIVPVEFKSGRLPQGPLFSHIIQLAAYCLILEEKEGKKVTRGVLRYGEHEFDIDFDEALRSLVIGKLSEMRGALVSNNVHRNHNRPGKCRSCSRREMCSERLE